MTQTALPPAEFAAAIEQHYIEASDDYRKIVVGLQQESREAEIYARHSHIYTQGQLELLAAERDAAADPEQRAELERLWFDAADAMASRDIVQAAQDLTNQRLAWRTRFDGQDASINGLGAMLASEPDFDRREQIYQLICESDEHFAAQDLELAVTSSGLRSDVFGLDGEVAIATARTGVDIPAFSEMVQDVCERTAGRYALACTRMNPVLLGRDVAVPSRGQAPYMRSLHQWDHVYTRARMAEVCERTIAELGFPLNQLPTIHADLEDRPQKDPRACVVATRVPDEVYLVVRPTGGLTDYGAFLHEAGHALHYGLTDSTLPFSLRYSSPDHALTEIYSYVVERITHSPLWHQHHFGLSDADAQTVCEQARFIDTGLFRRYAAKLAYELHFWADPADPRNPDRYAMLLSNATGQRYSTSSYVSDMDPGLYAADYLRAWRTSEQVIAWLEREYGEDWFITGKAAEFLRSLFHQGTRPANEDVGRQLGYEPGDWSALERLLS
jgi:hypothetical protein